MVSPDIQGTDVQNYDPVKVDIPGKLFYVSNMCNCEPGCSGDRCTKLRPSKVHEQVISYPASVIIMSEVLANLELAQHLGLFSSEGSLIYHTYCN
jgi:hypothetical protein